MNTLPHTVECTIPILPVGDLARSITFYTETLGFRLDWGGPEDGVCSVSKDACCIMLASREGLGRPAWVWIGLENDELFEVYRAKGVKVVQEPCRRPWAYEMKFEDLDGNVLWLGTEPRQADS